jgi:pentatricopeptide repeat protein
VNAVHFRLRYPSPVFHQGHRGVEPNVVSFGAALAACAKAGRWQRCLTLLKEMSLRGLAPNGPCFDTAIDALEAAGQVENQRIIRMLYL